MHRTGHWADSTESWLLVTYSHSLGEEITTAGYAGPHGGCTREPSEPAGVWEALLWYKEGEVTLGSFRRTGFSCSVILLAGRKVESIKIRSKCRAHCPAGRGISQVKPFLLGGGQNWWEQGTPSSAFGAMWGSKISRQCLEFLVLQFPWIHTHTYTHTHTLIFWNQAWNSVNFQLIVFRYRLYLF